MIAAIIPVRRIPGSRAFCWSLMVSSRADTNKVENNGRDSSDENRDVATLRAKPTAVPLRISIKSHQFSAELQS